MSPPDTDHSPAPEEDPVLDPDADPAATTRERVEAAGGLPEGPGDDGSAPAGPAPRVTVAPPASSATARRRRPDARRRAAFAGATAAGALLVRLARRRRR